MVYKYKWARAIADANGCIVGVQFKYDSRHVAIRMFEELKSNIFESKSEANLFIQSYEEPKIGLAEENRQLKLLIETLKADKEDLEII